MGISLRTNFILAPGEIDPTVRTPGKKVQAPLVLRWDVRRHWIALRDVLGCDEEIVAVAISLWSEAMTTGRWTSYSRSHDHYARFGSVLYTYARVIKAVEWLDQNGFIDHFRQDQDSGDEWQSCMRARPHLVELVGEVIAAHGRPFPFRVEPIVLRDAKKRPMAFEMTPEIAAMGNRVRRINEFNRDAVVSCGMGELYRIFNRTFDRGGRWYVGGCWQQMPDYDRALILIDGEESIELDIKTLHPSMLYSEAGLPVPEDCYAIPGWDRDLVKTAFLVVVNAKNKYEATASLAKKDAMEIVAAPGSPDAVLAARELIAEIRDRHSRIRHAFMKDRGAFLMRRDSDMTDQVLTEMVDKRITCLPLHDSYIVKRSARDVLEAAMRKALKRAGLPDVRIEVKIPKERPADAPEGVDSRKSRTSSSKRPTYASSSLPSSLLLQSSPAVQEESQSHAYARLPEEAPMASEASLIHEAEGLSGILDPFQSPSQARTVPDTAAARPAVQEASQSATAAIRHLRSLSPGPQDLTTALEAAHGYHVTPEAFWPPYEPPQVFQNPSVQITWGQVARTFIFELPSILIRRPQESESMTSTAATRPVGHRISMIFDPGSIDPPCVARIWQARPDAHWTISISHMDTRLNGRRYHAESRQQALEYAFLAMRPPWMPVDTMTVAYDGPFDPKLDEAENREKFSVLDPYMFGCDPSIQLPDPVLSRGTVADHWAKGTGHRLAYATDDGSHRYEMWMPLKPGEAFGDGRPMESVFAYPTRRLRIGCRLNEKTHRQAIQRFFDESGRPWHVVWDGPYDAEVSPAENERRRQGQRRAA